MDLHRLFDRDSETKPSRLWARGYFDRLRLTKRSGIRRESRRMSETTEVSNSENESLKHYVIIYTGGSFAFCTDLYTIAPKSHTNGCS